MADAAVKFLLSKLSDIIVQNASLIADVHDEFEDIKQELESMSSFIRDADRRKEVSPEVKTWVKQVREVASKIEDIVDEYIHHKEMTQHKKGFKGIVQDIVKLPKSVRTSYDLALKIKKIKVKIKNISERSKTYSFEKTDKGGTLDLDTHRDRWQHYGESSFFINKEEIVGMDENKEKLRKLLIGDEIRLTIISIVGMGGLGKTTLVTNVYNDQVIKQQFDCWAWVSVSQTIGVEELLRNIIRELLKNKQAMSPRNFGSMNYRQLAEMLIDTLHDEKYVIVLDDVWSIDLWSRIRCAFPDNNCGSRIIFTTRNANVASSVGPRSHVHPLKPLSESESWALFCNKAFWNSQDRSCPKELELSARAIMKKCEGLPLAIVAIGGLMYSKTKTVTEWKKIHDSLNWQLSKNPVLGQVKGMLLLSFNDLPYYLKHCFLYCCVFRDGCLIKRKKLIRLWVAEGFVVERKGLTIEEVAEEYLVELILRSMIQVTETNVGGRVKTCKVHDVMRELALTMSEEDNFCTTYDGQGPIFEGKFQRLSVCNRGRNIQLCKSMSKRLRSYFVFETDTCSLFSLGKMSSNFKFLKVLDLEGVHVERLPGEITNLFILRYLNLRNTKVQEVPKSMEKLKSLQTLDLRNTRLAKLPSGISKLEKLRHLFLGHVQHNDPNSDTSNFPRGIRAPAGITCVQSLQTLTCIIAEKELIGQLGSLSELRRLDITELQAVDGPTLCSSIQNLATLRSLGVKAATRQELNLQDLRIPPLFLEKLTLIGQLKTLPNWIKSLANLTHLSLGSSQLEDDAVSSLQLPSLLYLELNKAYKGRDIYFREGYFPKLQKLKLRRLMGLDSLRIKNGSLPSIGEMFLIRCLKLKTLPQGIEHLTNLQTLHVEEMPEEFVKSLEIDIREDNGKVQHIPTINVV